MTERRGSSAEGGIVVGVRLRPFVGYEQGQKQCMTITNGNMVSIIGEVAGKESKDFQFDEAMDSSDPNSSEFVGQAKCYELMAERMVDHVFQGYNTCLFCYGQTGTGKTTTIMGKTTPATEQGLLLRLLSDVFIESDRLTRDTGSTIHIKVQMLEVYNEKIKDLLLPHGLKSEPMTSGSAEPAQKPDVHVHPVLGVYLKGVTEEAVDNCEHVLRLIDYGNTMKTVAATAMNAKSSRAHTVFKLSMEKKGGHDNMAVMSEVFFVDLAGRENEKTTKVAGERLVELTFINKSLMFLSQCIQKLGSAEGGRRKTVMTSRKTLTSFDSGKDGTAVDAPKSGDLEPATPKSGAASWALARKSLAPTSGGPSGMAGFRNSKLTLLLSNALSGNSKTSMIGTLSPAVANFEESFSTLTFANTVKNIKVDAKPATAVDKESLVVSLQEELRQLKEQLVAAQEKIDTDDIMQNIEGTQMLSNRFQKSWNDDRFDAEEMMLQREKSMEKLGVTRFSMLKGARLKGMLGDPCDVPYVANYSDDYQLSGCLTFRPAQVGQDYCVGFGEEADFKVPHGLGMLPKTCYLKRDGRGQMFIRANERGGQSAILAEVNGVRVGTDWTELQHQDCIVLGRSLIFYAFTKKDGGVHALPESKKQSIVSSGEDIEGLDSTETLIKAILGPSRRSDMEQSQLTDQYYKQMQQQNRDNDGKTSLRNFLLQARRAGKLVEEANEITKEVKPKSKHGDLTFELTAMAPVLAFGFGASSFPEFCVRLVRKVPEKQAEKRVHVEKLRRKSVLPHVEMLRKFTQDGFSQSVETESASVEVLHTWSFPKFTARLQSMQDAHEAWTQDSENFELDPMLDPWSEYGPVEIAQLQKDQEEILSDTHNELRRVRRENSGTLRDSHLAHCLITRPQANSNGVAPGSPGGRTSPAAVVATAAAELVALRQRYTQLEVNNAHLRDDLARAQADMAVLLGTDSNGRAQSPHGDRSQSPRRGQDKSTSAQAAYCLRVSKDNLSLVEDLFRLSLKILKAGSASLNGPNSTGMLASAEQGRLADAAAALVAQLERAPLPPSPMNNAVGSGMAAWTNRHNAPPLVAESALFPSASIQLPASNQASAVAPAAQASWMHRGVATGSAQLPMPISMTVAMSTGPGLSAEVPGSLRVRRGPVRQVSSPPFPVQAPQVFPEGTTVQASQVLFSDDQVAVNKFTFGVVLAPTEETLQEGRIVVNFQQTVDGGNSVLSVLPTEIVIIPSFSSQAQVMGVASMLPGASMPLQSMWPPQRAQVSKSPARLRPMLGQVHV